MQHRKPGDGMVLVKQPWTRYNRVKFKWEHGYTRRWYKQELHEFCPTCGIRGMLWYEDDGCWDEEPARFCLRCDDQDDTAWMWAAFQNHGKYFRWECARHKDWTQFDVVYEKMLARQLQSHAESVISRPLLLPRNGVKVRFSGYRPISVSLED